MVPQTSVHYLILKYFIVVGIIVTLLHFIVKYVSRMILQKFMGKRVYDLYSDGMNSELSLEEKIANQLMEVQKLAQKISEEKQVLESPQFEIFGSEDYLADARMLFSTFRDNVNKHLEKEDRRSQLNYEESLQTMVTLKREMLAMKAEMEQIVNSWQALESEKTKKSPQLCVCLVENGAQTEESYDSFHKETYDCEVSEENLMTIKKWLAQVVDELGKESMDENLEFLSTLKEHYEGLKSLIASSWQDVSTEFSNFGAMLDKVQIVEQTVFGIFIFLQQQSVDAQTVRETLKFYDHKFAKFMKKSDTRWKKSCSALDQAFESVKKAQAVMKENSALFRDLSIDASSKLSCLDTSVKEFGHVTTLLNDAEYLTFSVEKTVSNLVKDVANMSAKIDGVYCQWLSKLSGELLKPGEKLYILFKTTEDLNGFIENLKSPLRNSSSNKMLKDTESENANPENETESTCVEEKTCPNENGPEIGDELLAHINKMQTSGFSILDNVIEEVKKTLMKNDTFNKENSTPENTSEIRSKVDALVVEELTPSVENLNDISSDCLQKNSSDED